MIIAFMEVIGFTAVMAVIAGIIYWSTIVTEQLPFGLKIKDFAYNTNVPKTSYAIAARIRVDNIVKFARTQNGRFYRNLVHSVEFYGLPFAVQDSRIQR